MIILSQQRKVDNMKVLLVGHDFDFSAGDGVSRYSYEIYKGISKYVSAKTITVGKLPRPVRAMLPITAKGYDIVHAMYPDVARIAKGGAKMVTMWHDLRMLSKYSAGTQARYKPKLSERYGIANRIIKSWVDENYLNTDALVTNSTKTLEEAVAYLKKEGIYSRRKIYRAIPLGIDEKFLHVNKWNGARRDFAFIGSIHLKHKNLFGLLSAFDGISGYPQARAARLHIFTQSAGARTILSSRLKAFPRLSHRNVILHVNMPDDAIIKMLPKFVACLHLSKEEGFGFPILESMAAGTRVILLKKASIPREVSKYAIKANENEIPEIAAGMIDDSKPASSKAIQYAKSFTWGNTVKKTLEVYNKILEQ